MKKKNEFELAKKRFLEDDTFYVWRNESGKLVAYLNYRLFEGSAKLGNVYTLEEERRKGSARRADQSAESGVLHHARARVPKLL